MDSLIQKINKNYVDYEKIKNENSHIVLFDNQKNYDINVIIGVRNRKNFLIPVIESFQAAIKNSDKNICITILNHASFPEHLKYCKENKINYIWSKGNVEEQYSRSFSYNFAVKYSNKANFYLLHDVDILVKKDFFSEIDKNIANFQCMQTYGKRRVLYLSSELTEKIINKEIDYNELNESYPGVSLPMYNGKPALGSKGGSIIISRELFFKVGGFDPELFWGYAAEDQFFWEKVKTISEISYADNPPVDMFHMWHPPSVSTNPLLYEMERNWDIFKSLSSDLKKEIIQLKANLLDETNNIQ